MLFVGARVEGEAFWGVKKFGRARSCWWLDCCHWLRNRLVAKIIFYSHLPAMEGKKPLKTGGCNEKRFEGTIGITKTP